MGNERTKEQLYRQNEYSAREQRGLGLAIMDELMDSVVVEPFANGTTVPMQRRLAMR